VRVRVCVCVFVVVPHFDFASRLKRRVMAQCFDCLFICTYFSGHLTDSFWVFILSHFVDFSISLFDHFAFRHVPWTCKVAEFCSPCCFSSILFGVCFAAWQVVPWIVSSFRHHSSCPTHDRWSSQRLCSIRSYLAWESWIDSRFFALGFVSFFPRESHLEGNSSKDHFFFFGQIVIPGVFLSCRILARHRVRRGVRWHYFEYFRVVVDHRWRSAHDRRSSQRCIPSAVVLRESRE